MITLIWNEKRILLTEEYLQSIRLYNVKDALVVFRLDSIKVEQIMDILMMSEVNDVLVVGNPEENLECFKHTLKLVKAGGGLVLNNRDEILFIYRHKRWDLPKGKCDPGETTEECALREVREETGLQNLSIEKPLCITYHIYLEQEMILKETHWFQMYSTDRWLTPQTEEGIKKAIWVHRNNIRFQLEKTYPSVLQIFQRFAQLN
ncbi:MAG TPA: NUDIX domain-containing protein [Chitinophagaceae bacterium]|nr:NUDIX domain-containing protein [Chitinophagaceae bacterium]